MNITCPHCNESISIKVDKPAKKGAPDPIWDTVCEVFGLKPVAPTELSRVGKCVKNLKAKRVSVDDIRERAHRYQVRYPKMSFTPEAVFKHWDSLGDQQPASAQQEMEF